MDKAWKRGRTGGLKRRRNFSPIAFSNYGKETSPYLPPKGNQHLGAGAIDKALSSYADVAQACRYRGTTAAAPCGSPAKKKKKTGLPSSSARPLVYSLARRSHQFRTFLELSIESYSPPADVTKMSQQIEDMMRRAAYKLQRGGGPPPRNTIGFILGAIGLVGGGIILQNSLFNVEGGHRAIKYRRITGVSKEIYSEGTVSPKPRV